MKKLFTVLALLSICSVLFAPPLPVPEKISYQAVIRNSSNALITNHLVGMKISILHGSATGTILYTEKQTPTTNANGLISIVIGTGFVVGGNFSTIDWSAGPYFIKTETDPTGGMAYSITATSELLSVPYALHAKTAISAQNLIISGGAYTPEYVVDIDGNAYKTIKIGTQVWMAENLKTTRYRNGAAIPKVTDNTAWAALTTDAWCDNNNKAVNGSKYGHLYNWYAVADSRNIAPEGWHVPTDAELTTLENYLIANGGNWDGTITTDKIGKSLAACTNWKSHTTEGNVGTDLSSNNSSGFAALPGGYRSSNGSFGNIGDFGNWWSSTESSTTNAWDRELSYYNIGLNKGGHTKSYGYSVRCVRD